MRVLCHADEYYAQARKAGCYDLPGTLYGHSVLAHLMFRYGMFPYQVPGLFSEKFCDPPFCAKRIKTQLLLDFPYGARNRTDRDFLDAIEWDIAEMPTRPHL